MTKPTQEELLTIIEKQGDAISFLYEIQDYLLNKVSDVSPEIVMKATSVNAILRGIKEGLEND